MAQHNDLGRWGEAAAADYLSQNGYAIVERNARIGRTEVDIIAMKGDSIMFVEVKTRSTHFKDPVDAITPDKIRRLTRAADTYVRTMNIPHRPQFDVIAIVGTKSKFELVHYPDAFLPALISR